MRMWIVTASLLACILPAAAQAKPETTQIQPIVVTANWGPAMLGTTTVRIRADRFSGSWAQALSDASGLPEMQRLIAPARNLQPAAQMAYVQRAVHSNIRWISDATEWGKHDYWATAAQTLSHRAGDMEDRAIVKLQALKALGFDQRDLFLTLARDRVGGPLTVVTVRSNGRYWIIDDTGGAPFLAESRSFEFQPILSFGWTGAWAHRKPGPATTIATMATTSVNARR